jgi:acyl-CoA reductase-like NAD-dependent aldehyde dehydrogenase
MEQTPVRVAGTRITKERSIEVRNPYSHEVIGLVPGCDAATVAVACEAAAAALARDDFPQYRRAEVLEKAARLVSERIDEFGRTIALEAGKPIRTARAEATRCVDTLTFAATEARKLTGEMIPMDASQSGYGRLAFALRVPIGVVAAITPFNFPLNLVAHKLAPAIAAGCPVVLKPASSTPFSSIMLVELLIESGMPHDWVSVVTGSGMEVGEALVTNPIPALVTFTGSPAVGWHIPGQAPRKKISLELGSNSPLIVEPDADLDLVASKVRVAGFSHAGQSCISTQRILVHESIHERFVDVLAEAIGTLVVGDPLDEATDVGPLISPEDTQRVHDWIDAAVADGATVAAGGVLEDGLLMPTLVDNVSPDVDLCAKEVFGPVVVVLAYSTFDEALEMADTGEYGLHAGIFTTDLRKALTAVRKLHFGGILINEVPTYRADQQPYGGVKASGNTREGPAYAVHEMTQLRFVHLG